MTHKEARIRKRRAICHRLEPEVGQVVGQDKK